MDSYILIKRSSQYMNRFREIDIFIDGKKVGSVRNAENKKFSIKPGVHEVFAEIDWFKAETITIHTAPGQTATLICDSEITGWKLCLFYLWYDAFSPGSIIRLRKETELKL